jgi:hypothetical protein
MRNKGALLSLLIMAMALLLAKADAVRAQQSSEDDSSPLVYVVGHVVRARSIPFKPSITITQAVAMAGGVLPDAGVERVAIFRYVSEHSPLTMTLVDLKAIAKRRAEDRLLQPYEIVEVLSKKLIKRRKKDCPRPPCYIVIDGSRKPGERSNCIFY